MQYFIKTKTPIWTGGAKSISDTIYETGILGSLRWWYEVILRGLGRFACDPTEDENNRPYKRCPIEVNHAKKYCNACDLFGATGHQRQFKVNFIRGELVFDQKAKEEFINIRPQQCQPPRQRGWYLGAGRIATDTHPIMAQFTPFAHPTETDNTLKVLLSLLSRWAGIGARQQHGYGIFDITNRLDQTISISEDDLNNFLAKATAINADTRNTNHGTELPSFKNFFFAKVKLDNLPANWENNLDGTPLDHTRDGEKNIDKQRKNFNEWHGNHSSSIFAPALKNQLRFVVFDSTIVTANRGIQEELFGKSNRSSKSAANVNVSHIYDENNHKEVRIWGEVSNNVTKQKIYDALNGATYPQKPAPASQQTIWQAATGQSGVTAQVTEWREMGGNARCKKAGATCTTPCTGNPESFLRCLLS